MPNLKRISLNILNDIKNNKIYKYFLFKIINFIYLILFTVHIIGMISFKVKLILVKCIFI